MNLSRLIPFVVAFALPVSFLAAADHGWISLFDGKTLNGWRTSENPSSPRVADGMLVAEGKRAHVFYVGEDGRAEFENFELELEVKTEPGANSGVYFLTRWQDSGWPNAGFEAQVNNRQPPFKEYDYRENKKTASLYGTRNLYKPLAEDGEWFTMNIRVARPRVEIRLNGRLVSSYVEPANPVLPSPGPQINRLGKGTFALQCHDEDSRAYYRSIRVRRLPPGEDASVTKPVYSEQDLQRLAIGKDNFPIVDLRVTADGALAGAELEALRLRTGIFPGVVFAAEAFPSDSTAIAAAAALKDVPVFAGLDVSGFAFATAVPGGSNLTTSALAAFDYLLVTKSADAIGGDFLNMTEAAANEARMDNHVDSVVHLIETQPIDVYANVMVLPRGIHGSPEERWTEARMQKVIAAAARHGVAFEINRHVPTPSLKFIQLAKAAGVKFTVGADAATPANYEDWAYILEVQRKDKANLGWRDMWVPGHFPTRAQKALLKN